MSIYQAGLTVSEAISQLSRRFDDADLFYGHGTDNAFDEAAYLVLGYLQIPHEVDEGELSRQLTEDEQEALGALADQRINERVPVAYLLGKAWFAGLPFHVNRDVLIPRSPIAELIDQGFEPLLTAEPARILDLCAGSGCIGIACAVAFPDAQVELADISDTALEVAGANCVRHAVSDRVRTVRSDLFEQIEGQFDLIVSNPPYVSSEEIAELPTEYRWEPELGLLAADEGLQIPLKIMREASAYLKPEGLLILELGHSWPALADRLAPWPLLWLEFSQGGEGVLAVSRAELQKWMPE